MRLRLTRPIGTPACRSLGAGRLSNCQIAKLFLPGSIWLSDPQKSYHLVNLFAAHLLRHGMIAGVDADEGGGVIIVDLDLGKIGNAVFPLREDAVTLGAMQLI